MPSAIITGVATGLGRDLSLQLARAGYHLTCVDIDADGLQQTAQEIQQSSGSQIKVVTHVMDVCNQAGMREVVQSHAQRHGSIDLAVLNAGIGERGQLLDPTNEGWQKCLDVDLTAVIAGTREVSLVMLQQKEGGTIITIASAGGMYPMPAAPVYAASKAGVVHFVRSIGPTLGRKGVRLMAVCPEFVDTPLVRKVMQDDPEQARRMLGSLDIQLLPPSAVTALTMELITSQQKGGSVVLLRQDGSVQFPFSKTSSLQTKTKDVALVQRRRAWATTQVPSTYRKLQVHRLDYDFAAATRLVEVPLSLNASTLPKGHILVRRVYVGINASDINFTAGRYFNNKKEAEAKLPYDCGFETVSVVAAVGPGVTGLETGDSVASLTYDGFAEWGVLPAQQALPVPDPSPEAVACLTSGLTASIALEECGKLKKGDTVLVTAAAGGTGQFAVQLAALAGCHVIATGGGPDKVAFLRKLGAHRVVDYRSEDLKTVLKTEYPRGVDVVYESVGGSMFTAAMDSLAQGGGLIIIGMMSSYQEGWPLSTHKGLPEKLLWKNASLHGFFLLRHARQWKAHLAKLLGLHAAGKLHIAIDPTPFKGIQSVPAAVNHLQSGKSVGKVVVQLCGDLPPDSKQVACRL